VTVHDFPVDTLTGQPGSLGGLAGRTPDDPGLIAAIAASLPG
jgi:hypothetical protein